MRTIRVLVTGALALALLAGCGDDDGEEGTGPAAGDEATADDEATDGGSGDGGGEDAGDGDAAPAGGGGGTIELDGESIAVERTLCYLEPQDSAAGGGQILFTGQGFGTNGAGDEVMIDVSRYDEDSMFAGDSVSLVVGDPMSEDAMSYSGEEAEGAVTLDGSTLSASGMTLLGDDGSELSVSFELSC